MPALASIKLRSLDAPWQEDEHDPQPAPTEMHKPSAVGQLDHEKPPDVGAVLLRVNRFLSFADIVAQYGGPLAMWESLRSQLPVWSVHNGEPVYLESAVDDYLRTRVCGADSPPAAQTDTSIPTDDAAILTLEQAARLVHVAPKTVLNWCAKDPVNQPRLKGGTFRRGEFIRWWTKTRRSKK